MLTSCWLMNKLIGNATVFKYEYPADKVYIVFMQNGNFIFEEKMVPTEDIFGCINHEATLVSSSTLIISYTWVKHIWFFYLIKDDE